MKAKDLFFNMMWKCNQNYHICYYENGDEKSLTTYLWTTGSTRSSGTDFIAFIGQ